MILIHSLTRMDHFEELIQITVEAKEFRALYNI